MQHAIRGLLLLLLLPIIGNAQVFPLRNYTMQDGLAHDNVFRALQDRRGFLCFATNYGLSIFDGRHFRNYTTRDGLTNNCIISLTEDDKGNKILSTYGGGICIMSADGKIHPLEASKGKLPANVLYAVSFRNSIWVIGLDTIGYRLFRYENGVSQKVAARDSKGKEIIFTKGIYTRLGLFFSTNVGLYQLDNNLRLSPLFPDIISKEIIDVRPGFDNDYWASTPERLIHFNSKGILKELPFEGRSRISSILPQSGDRVWVATVGAGLFLIQKDSVSRLSASLHLPNIILNDMLQESEGSLWIATHGEGLYRLNALDILHYVPQPGRMNVYCKAIVPLDEEKLLIGSIGTISTWEADSLRPLPVKNLAAADFVYFISVAGKSFYFGTPRGLFKKSLLPPFAEREILHNGRHEGSISFYTDGTGKQWIGSFNGLYQLSGDSLIFIANRSGLNQRINAISEDGKGKLWLGTEDGLESYDIASGTFLKVNTTPALKRVNAIISDSRKRLWAATSDGLVCKDGERFRMFTIADGLVHNGCDALAVHNNTLLIGTVNGLCYLDLNTLKIESDQSNIYPNQVLSLYAAGGRVFAGLVNGLSVLLQKSSVRSDPPPLFVTAIKSGKRELPLGKIVDLSYDDNKLSVEFIGISFRYADRVQYRYKILNLDNNWHITTNNAIELPALPSGNYALVLNARLGAGEWSKDLVLPINIATPFWRTWWFAILTVILSAALVIFIVRHIITRREIRKREQLSVYNKIIYLKQQALSALINPHFIFNCMNSIQHFLNRNDKDRANDYLADFALLIRMTMEQAQEAFITIENEVARIRLYLSLEQLRFGNDLLYEINIDPALDTSAIRIPNMMLQPYVENALWHGIMPKKAPGNISISFVKWNEVTLKISVVDDGKGLDNNCDADGLLTLRKAYGRRLTEERLTLLSTLLEQYYNVAAGPAYPGTDTPGLRIEITLPIQPKHELLAAMEREMNNVGKEQ